jgi:hypothetical protein
MATSAAVSRSHVWTCVRWWQMWSTRRQNTHTRCRPSPPKNCRSSSHHAAVPAANCVSRSLVRETYLPTYSRTSGLSPAGSRVSTAGSPSPANSAKNRRSERSRWAKMVRIVSTREVLYRLDDGILDGIRPKAVVLMIGTNNFGLAGDSIEVSFGIVECPSPGRRSGEWEGSRTSISYRSRTWSGSRGRPVNSSRSISRGGPSSRLVRATSQDPARPRRK